MRPRFIHFTVVALLSSCANQYPVRPISFLGDPAPSTAATHTIIIRPDTKWVNVDGGDIVNFVVGDESFAWSFNVASGVLAFQLNDVAPPGMLDHRVDAFVAPDIRYYRY